MAPSWNGEMLAWPGQHPHHQSLIGTLSSALLLACRHAVDMIIGSTPRRSNDRGRLIISAI